MRNFIIPWPSQYSGDFKTALETLECVGYPPLLFILNFIFAHGNASWAVEFSGVEGWVEQKLYEHMNLLMEIMDVPIKDIEELREYKIYYDNIDRIMYGMNGEYDGDLHAIVAILKYYYSSIILPDLGDTEHSSVTNFLDLENGYACVTFNSSLGDLINGFYNTGRNEDHSHHSVPIGETDHGGVFGIHGVNPNAALNGHR